MVERLGLNRVGGKGSEFNDNSLKCFLSSVPVVVNGREEDWLWIWGRTWAAGGGAVQR